MCCVRVLRRVRFKSNQLPKLDLVSLFNLQGLLLCPQTLSQTRRARLRRAFTEATGDTVTYVKTVGFKLLDYAPPIAAVDCTTLFQNLILNKYY